MTCARCNSKRVIVTLDGDPLCFEHAKEWALGEGQAEQERKRETPR